MTDSYSFNQFAILVAVSILVAYGVTLLLAGAVRNRLVRVTISAVLATIFVHAYLILSGQGTDQLVLVSILMMLVYGWLGSFLLDWLKTRFLSTAP